MSKEDMCWLAGTVFIGMCAILYINCVASGYCG